MKKLCDQTGKQMANDKIDPNEKWTDLMETNAAWTAMKQLKCQKQC